MTRLNLATLGSTWDDARRVSARKSCWMVLWLRARRDGDALRYYYRKQHLSEMRRP
jgi:hypothetical protein